MKKTKRINMNTGISSEHLAELQHKTIIESTGPSLRLSGSKITSKKVKQIMKLSKPSERE